MMAALVIPTTPKRPRRMAPAPRKPTPETIWAAIRPASVLTPRGVKYAAGPKEIIVNTAEPRPTMVRVRMPVGLFFFSRSAPTIAPHTAATSARRTLAQGLGISGSNRLQAISCRLHLPAFEGRDEALVIAVAVAAYATAKSATASSSLADLPQ